MHFCRNSHSAFRPIHFRFVIGGQFAAGDIVKFSCQQLAFERTYAVGEESAFDVIVLMLDHPRDDAVKLFGMFFPVFIEVLYGDLRLPEHVGEDPAQRANRIEIRDVRCRGAMLGDYWMFGDEALCITIVNSIDWHQPESAPATTLQTPTQASA